MDAWWIKGPSNNGADGRGLWIQVRLKLGSGCFPVLHCTLYSSLRGGKSKTKNKQKKTQGRRQSLVIEWESNRSYTEHVKRFCYFSPTKKYTTVILFPGVRILFLNLSWSILDVPLFPIKMLSWLFKPPFWYPQIPDGQMRSHKCRKVQSPHQEPTSWNADGHLPQRWRVNPFFPSLSSYLWICDQLMGASPIKEHKSASCWESKSHPAEINIGGLQMSASSTKDLGREEQPSRGES